MIVPYAAGGADIYIRPLTDSLEKKKISLIIQNQVGAGGIVGSNAAPLGARRLHAAVRRLGRR